MGAAVDAAYTWPSLTLIRSVMLKAQYPLLPTVDTLESRLWGIEQMLEPRGGEEGTA